MLSIAARLILLATQLRTAIGRYVVRESRVQPVVWLGTKAYTPIPPQAALPKLPNPVWGLFVTRLARLAARFEALYTRWQTNTLPKPRPPRTRVAAPRAAAPLRLPVAAKLRLPAAAKLRLPSAFGWANRRIPEAAPPSGHLEALLHDPEAEKFVSAAPQAARLLRPLCQALGLKQPHWLKLPARTKPARPRPITPPKPTMRAIQQSARPFQPYVLATIRAWKPKFADSQGGRRARQSFRYRYQSPRNANAAFAPARAMLAAYHSRTAGMSSSTSGVIRR